MVEQETTAKPSPPARPFQFSLRHLFGILFFLGMLFASVYYLGFFGALFVVLFFGSIAGGIWLRKPIWSILGPLGVLCLGCVVLPELGTREPARRFVCQCYLKQIGLALHHYHSKNECFPPAFTVDELGTPVHSWRTTILPNLGHQPLHDSYDFSEPWNGFHNGSLPAPRDYRCPSDAKGRDGITNYLAVTGPGTAWPGAKCAKLTDFDDPSKVILVVEVVGANVHWSEPRDLVESELEPFINSKYATGISSRHKGGANVLYADGHVEFLSEDTLYSELQAMLKPPKK